MRMDPAGENKAMTLMLIGDGIKPEFSPVDTPQYNGVAERAIAVCKEGAHALMLDSNCDMKWWGAATLDYITGANMRPRNGWPNAYAPFNEPPPRTPSSLIPFGCPGMMKQKKKRLRKNFTPKSEAVFRVGYDNYSTKDSDVVVKASNKRVVSTRAVT